MKNLLLTLGIILLSLNTIAQNPIKFRFSASVTGDASDTIKTNINGTILKKGDTFDMWLAAAGNGNTTTRQLLLDFQFPNSALQLISMNNTGTGGNGGILPQNSNAQESYYEYVGYSFAPTTSNTTSNGTANYQNAMYNYVANGPSSIVRYTLTWSTTQGMPYGGYWSMVRIRFKVKDSLIGFNIDQIKLNFVAAWDGGGIANPTLQENPLNQNVYLNPNFDSYVNAKIDINANMTAVEPMKVMFYDTTAKVGHLFDITSNGNVNVDQTKLKANTTYRVMAMVNMDKLTQIQNAAVTVSDFTGPQNEFTKTGLDGTPANINMTTGASYMAADVNNDNNFNGSDLPILLANVVGLDTLLVTPTGYTVGSGGWMSVWTFNEAIFNNMTPTNWKTTPKYGLLFTTNKIGDYLPLNIKYLISGDVNRSHSSKVVRETNTIVTSSNTTSISEIDVLLNNLTVTSNTIEIPININTNGASIGGLQFQFEYDPTKIKFDELASNLPNTWYTFANSKNGKVKFGALDNSKTPIVGQVTPFKLKFSTIGNGVDILTSVKISKTMDASDTNGNQVKINLNTTQIKLTGYNNF